MRRFVSDEFETRIDKKLQFIYNIYTLFRKSGIITAKGKAADGSEQGDYNIESGKYGYQP